MSDQDDEDEWYEHFGTPVRRTWDQWASTSEEYRGLRLEADKRGIDQMAITPSWPMGLDDERDQLDPRSARARAKAREQYIKSKEAMRDPLNPYTMAPIEEKVKTKYVPLKEDSVLAELKPFLLALQNELLLLELQLKESAEMMERDGIDDTFGFRVVSNRLKEIKSALNKKELKKYLAKEETDIS